jgi:sRNA-binding carbon storage regulator CsrA
MTDAELLELRSNPISVSVTSVHGDRVKLGFGAPVPVQIQRKEAMLKNAQLISAGGSVTRQN